MTETIKETMKEQFNEVGYAIEEQCDVVGFAKEETMEERCDEVGYAKEETMEERCDLIVKVFAFSTMLLGAVVFFMIA